MWIVPLVLIADRITKVLAVSLAQSDPLVSYTPAVALVPGVLNIRYVRNTGVAFSMFSGGGIWLVIFTVALIAGLLAWLFVRADEPKLFRTGLWLIVAGGLGNLYDRLAYGYVIDFLEFDFVNFAIFNVADACICIGAGVAALSILMDEIRTRGKNAQKGNGNAE